MRDIELKNADKITKVTFSQRRKRVWIVIACLLLICGIGYGIIQLFYGLYQPQFNAQLSEVAGEDTDIILYQDFMPASGANGESFSNTTKLLHPNGKVILEGDLLVYPFAEQDMMVFYTPEDPENVLKLMMKGEIRNIKKPEYAQNGISGISLSPDGLYLEVELVDEQDQEYWIFYNINTETWSRDIRPSINPLLFTNSVETIHRFQIDFLWNQEKPHLMEIRFFEMKVGDANFVTNIEENPSFLVTYDPEIDQFQQEYFKLIQAATANAIVQATQMNFNTENPVINKLGYVLFIPFRILGYMMYLAVGSGGPGGGSKYENIDNQPENTAVIVNDPLIGKQSIVYIDKDNSKKSLLSWFSTRGRYNVQIYFLESGKMLVRINENLGVLNPETGRFAKLLTVPFDFGAETSDMRYPYQLTVIKGE